MESYDNGAGRTTGLPAMFSGGATTYYQQDHLSVRLTTKQDKSWPSRAPASSSNP